MSQTNRFWVLAKWNSFLHLADAIQKKTFVFLCDYLYGSKESHRPSVPTVAQPVYQHNQDLLPKDRLEVNLTARENWHRRNLRGERSSTGI